MYLTSSARLRSRLLHRLGALLLLAPLALAGAPGAQGRHPAAIAAQLPWTMGQAAAVAAARSGTAGARTAEPAEPAAAANASPAPATAEVADLLALGDREHARHEYVRALTVYRRAAALLPHGDPSGPPVPGARRGQGEPMGRAARAARAAAGVSTRILETGAWIELVAGNFGSAAALLDQALPLAERTGEPVLLTRVLNGLASVAGRRGAGDAALRLVRRALGISVAARDLSGTVNALTRLTIRLANRGEVRRALGTARQAMALAWRAGDPEDAALAVTSLGAVQVWSGDNAGAFRSYSDALVLYEMADDRLGVATAHNDVGAVYAWQGDADQAVAHLTECLRTMTAMGAAGLTGNTLYNLTEALQQRGDLAAAEATARRGVALGERLGWTEQLANQVSGLAEVEEARGDRGAALAGYERSLRLRRLTGDRVGEALELQHLAHLRQLQGESAVALALARRVRGEARAIGNDEYLWQTYATAGEALLALGRRAEARRDLELAIATIERLRLRTGSGIEARQRFFEDKTEPYDGMVELSIEQGDTAAAFAYADRAKGRVLLDTLRGRDLAGLQPPVAAPPRSGDPAGNGEVAAANRSAGSWRHGDEDASGGAGPEAAVAAAVLRARRDSEESLERLGVVPAPEPRTLPTGAVPRPPSGAALAGLLGAGTMLVEFTVLADRTYVFTLGGDETAAAPRVYRLAAGRRQLERSIEEFRRQVAGRDIEARAAGRALYDLLLAPAERRLQACRALVIVPDGVLWNLPFQALVLPDGRYVVERQAVSYAPSAAVLPLLVGHGGGEARRAGHRDLLALGNPECRLDRTAQAPGATPAGIGGGAMPTSLRLPAELSPLPDAQLEVQALAKLYGERRSTVYIGSQAVESRLKAEAWSYRILHIAAHGSLDDVHPMGSAIRLAWPDPDPAEDGHLEAREVLRLRLGADLVVLSGCQTGRGRLGRGEGIVGLTWAFALAGCPASVASQWRVDSAGTSRFMVAFHRALLAGATASEALRAAARTLLADPLYAHPFYWAAFELIGDGSRTPFPAASAG